MRSIKQPRSCAIVAALAFTAAAAIAQTSPSVKEDTMQLKSDKASLQRQITRLDADEARLKADTASGRMSAESKDAFAVYQARQSVSSENKQIGIDKEASLQMKADKEALQARSSAWSSPRPG